MNIKATAICERCSADIYSFVTGTDPVHGHDIVQWMDCDKDRTCPMPDPASFWLGHTPINVRKVVNA